MVWIMLPHTPVEQGGNHIAGIPLVFGKLQFMSFLVIHTQMLIAKHAPHFLQQCRHILVHLCIKIKRRLIYVSHTQLYDTEKKI